MKSLAAIDGCLGEGGKEGRANVLSSGIAAWNRPAVPWGPRCVHAHSFRARTHSRSPGAERLRPEKHRPGELTSTQNRTFLEAFRGRDSAGVLAQQSSVKVEDLGPGVSPNCPGCVVRHGLKSRGYCRRLRSEAPRPAGGQCPYPPPSLHLRPGARPEALAAVSLRISRPALSVPFPLVFLSGSRWGQAICCKAVRWAQEEGRPF